ncbi:MAG: Type II secretion system F domain-containing protein [Nitrosopumilales archaeon]|nr:MAG: Type II secretion system F domain-containing protein [Nitrosopumilales archaeon]
MQKVKVQKKPKELELPKPSLYYSEKFRVGIASVVASLIILVITLTISGPDDSTSTRSVGMVFALLAAIVPLALLQLKEVHRKESIDKFLPLFLLALVSSVRSGSNLIEALEHTAGRNMGALTAELKNLRANISWGMPIEDALENFAQRAGTRTSRRVVILLEMAIRIGGDIATNLDMIHKHVTELANIEKERRSSLAPYTYTIYIAFAVFIGISVILSSQFFTEIEKVQVMLQGMEGSKDTMFSSLVDMDIEELNGVLFNMAIIEAIFGGLAAGKIGTGSFVAGIKHIVIMVVIAVIAFSLI